MRFENKRRRGGEERRKREWKKENWQSRESESGRREKEAESG